MNFESKSVEVCQPNATVARLIIEVLEEVGAQARRCHPGDELGEALADLLVFDVDAQGQARQQLGRYEQAGAPVLLCGLRVRREEASSEKHPWLDRPFSAAGLLGQCAALLEIELDEGSLPIDGEPASSLQGEELIEELLAGQGPPTQEFEVDEASLLEEEFGLEPGVLGGRSDIQIDATAALDIRELEGAQDVLVDVDDPDAEIIGGGRLFSDLRAEAVDPSQMTRPASGRAPTTPPLRETQPTHPDMPAAPRAADTELTSRTTPPHAHDAIAAAATAGGGPPAGIDEEASLELRSFARMLAQAWDRIGLSARVEDRYDRLNRVLHALFERGLDGAGAELGRIPQTEGFSGSLRALSLVGLFRTIRDRKLRGRLEVSTLEQAYVLYLDAGVLADIDALAGDSEQMLLDILREQGALDGPAYQELSTEGDEQGGLAAPVEVRLRTEGFVSPEALRQGRQSRAREIFAQVCRARSGNFAFIEVFRGDAHAWPVHELGLSVDALVLELLREESVETGVSEATSRTRLVPDPSRLARIERDALTPTERELLRFFERGETLARARQELGHLGGELDRIIARLKRAELLQRTDEELPALRPSGEFDQAPERPEPRRRMPTPPTGPAAGAGELSPEERTVITDINARDLDARSHPAPEPDPAPSSPSNPSAHQEPTRPVKGHAVPPPEDSLMEDEELDRLLEELSQTSEVDDDEQG